MKKITIILKSGKELSFEVLDFDINYGTITEQVTKLNWYGMKNRILFHIVPSEIAAIYYENLPEEA